MFNKIENVLKLIQPTDKVLDVGGGAGAFPRADAVIDILDYDSRYSGVKDKQPENYSREDWYVGDLCSPEVWERISDKQFDFVLCSHVLEDVRDPVFVCSQLVRVAKAGYIEVPSRFRECAKTSGDHPITGWEHHPWVVEVDCDAIIFKYKNPWINCFDFLGDQRRDHVFDYFNQFTGIHWIGSFDYKQREHKGHIVEVEDLFYYFEHYPYEQKRDFETAPTFYRIENIPHRGKSFEMSWDYRTEVEKAFTLEEIQKSYQERTQKMEFRFRESPPGIRTKLQLKRAKDYFRNALRKLDT
jgi:hypothetical protein